MSLNPAILQTQTKINRTLPSLGLERAGGPINLNAILQCFANIPEISEGLLELGYNKFLKKEKILFYYQEILLLLSIIFFFHKNLIIIQENFHLRLLLILF